MKRAVLIMICGLIGACNLQPVAPVLVPAPDVAGVPTATPYVWESDSELNAWVANGVTTGNVVVTGVGAAAVIRIDLSQKASLRGPDLNPPFAAAHAQVRFRFIDVGVTDAPSMEITLRPSVLATSDDAVKLIGPNIPSAQRPLSRWIMASFAPTRTENAQKKFAIISIASSDISGSNPGSGFIEIDSITLQR